MSAEAVLAAVRRAVEDTGVDVTTDDVLARRRLEAALEPRLRPLSCGGCGDLDWEEDE